MVVMKHEILLLFGVFKKLIKFINGKILMKLLFLHQILKKTSTIIRIVSKIVIIELSLILIFILGHKLE